MNQRIANAGACAMIATASLLGAGCETLRDAHRTEAAQSELRTETFESTLFRLQQEVAALSARQEQLAGTLEQIRDQNNSLRQTVSADIRRIDDGLGRLDAARRTDREEVVRVLTERVNTALSRAETPATPARRTERGYEHVVKPGETLSQIVSAYNANMRQVIEVNSIDRPDQLRVGQKLFIPAP